MTSTININGKVIGIKASADVLVIYKAQFGTDYVSDCLKLDEETADTESCVMTAFKLLWSMAKAYNAEILPPTEWAVSLGDFDLEEPIKKAQELYAECLSRYNTEEVERTGESITAEKIIAYAALAGMSLKDLNTIPLPMALETITTYIKTKYGSKEAREATQEDFDNF